ncbi:MAG TPA: hypothetical protein VN372_07080 [Methanospirillum sp.]|nr:hypothetical protein [Methanospirillum sp.]
MDHHRISVSRRYLIPAKNGFYVEVLRLRVKALHLPVLQPSQRKMLFSILAFMVEVFTLLKNSYPQVFRKASDNWFYLFASEHPDRGYLKGEDNKVFVYWVSK